MSISSPCNSSLPASSSLESHPLLGHLSQVWSLVGDQTGTSTDISSECPCLESLTDEPVGEGVSGLGSIERDFFPSDRPPTTGHLWLFLGFSAPGGLFPWNFSPSREKRCSPASSGRKPSSSAIEGCLLSRSLWTLGSIGIEIALGLIGGVDGLPDSLIRKPSYCLASLGEANAMENW